MIRFDLRAPDATLVTESGEAPDGLYFEGNESAAALFVQSKAPALEARLEWDFTAPADALVLGDTFERSYADLGFLPLADNDRPMPWYFLVSDGDGVFCLGVKTRPNAFVSFRASPGKITAAVDLRNGGAPVFLGDRTLEACTFVARFYRGKTLFDALRDFCRAMCADPILPDGPVYGGNDWYYAYGDNSAQTILTSARLVAELSEGLKARPFMVVDDGWSLHRTAGPWLPNDKFGDMAALAEKIKALGVRPGLWFRPLRTEGEDVPDEELILRRERDYLDPTVPAVKERLRADVRRFKNWGFELVKYDYSTFDLFGGWGKNLGDYITNEKDWHFSDRTKTNAEIAKDLYALIREEAGGMLLIGCNTVSHLCAGYVHLNRIGDDTSGNDWARTRDMGVNTLAFRLAQNGAFYMADADCVGIIGEKIPWEKNGAFLDLLSRSGTALFVSCLEANDEKKRDIAEAFRRAQFPHALEPLDWTRTRLPALWKCDGETLRYDWE